jgi:hypothetical protein
LIDDFYARGARIRDDRKLIDPFYLIEVSGCASDEAFIPLSESECPLAKAAD